MIVGLLTGRGESGSLKNKNVYPVLGRPLMVYPLLMAQRSRLLDDLYLSTDGERLKQVARQYGVKVIDRPPEYARPDSQHDECMQHALDVLRERGVTVDILVILMCNVGIQPQGKIDACIQALVDDPGLDAAVTIRDWGDHHPSRAKTIDEEGLLTPLGAVREDVTTTRQLLEPTFYLDHQVWALRIRDHRLAERGRPPWTFLGDRVQGIVNEELVVDVHNEADIRHTEMWLSAAGFTENDPPSP